MPFDLSTFHLSIYCIYPRMNNSSSTPEEGGVARGCKCRMQFPQGVTCPSSLRYPSLAQAPPPGHPRWSEAHPGTIQPDRIGHQSASSSHAPRSVQAHRDTSTLLSSSRTRRFAGTQQPARSTQQTHTGRAGRRNRSQLTANTTAKSTGDSAFGSPSRSDTQQIEDHPGGNGKPAENL